MSQGKRLSDAEVSRIRRLLGNRLSVRAVARLVGVDAKTVQKYKRA